MCVCAKSLQLCPTLCDLMECSLPGSSIHGILQARILEWVAMPSSRGSSWPRDWTCISCLPAWEVSSLPLAPLGKPWKCWPRTTDLPSGPELCIFSFWELFLLLLGVFWNQKGEQWQAECCGLSVSLPTKFRSWSPNPYVAAFKNRVSEEVIEVKWGHRVGPHQQD